ncbi:MAG: universal stress protein [Deltaproteobacteria bacterium]|nr:universal stress protein [Deltaproteobacteria bacterium]
MSRIDQFESVFLSASKPQFAHAEVHLGRVLVLTDLDESEAAPYGARVRDFLSGLGQHGTLAWEVVTGARCASIGDMLSLVESWAPDLVCAYRNLHSSAWPWPHSLSDHIEVLTQVTDVPVLLLPRPAQEQGWVDATGAPFTVMALTDHLAGDQRLVHWAVEFAGAGGQLLLAHVEQERVFERYMDVISKLPRIPTDLAREDIARQLLKEPADWADGVTAALSNAKVPIEVRAVVQMGQRLPTFRSIVEEGKVDLLVMNTKDEGQLAMHGLSYQIAVEMRAIPVLML